MNWTTGLWNENAWEENLPNLLWAADWAPVRALEEPLLAHPGGLYHPVLKEEMARATERIVNVETTLLDDPKQGRPVLKEGPCFGSPARAVEDLQKAGFGIALLANNHLGDFGPEGIVSTRTILREAGLRTVGAGESQADAYRALTFPLGSHTVALVNFHEGEEGTFTARNPALAGWDLERVRAEVVAQHRAGRVVLVAAHAGREFVPVQPRYVQEAYRSLIEAGARAVIGHHPHVPCGIESWQGCPIVYSQGNFVFWSGQPGLMRRLGYLVRLALTPEGTVALKLIPYRITQKGLRPLEEREKRWLFGQLAEVSGEALAPSSVQAYWEAAMDVIPREEWLRDATGMGHTAKLMAAANPQGLARLRTRLSGPAHVHFMVEGITRVLEGRHGQSDAVRQEKVRLWNEVPEEAAETLMGTSSD